MYAFKPLRNHTLLKVDNILTQRTFRTSHNKVVVKMDLRYLAEGQHAGLSHFASSSASLGVIRQDGHYRGDRIGIFNYNDISDSGYIDIDYFHYDH